MQGEKLATEMLERLDSVSLDSEAALSHLSEIDRSLKKLVEFNKLPLLVGAGALVVWGISKYIDRR